MIDAFLTLTFQINTKIAFSEHYPIQTVTEMDIFECVGKF